MAWKKLYEQETVAVGHVLIGDHQDPFMTIPVKGMIGKRVRVTVEEEVSECCEKWRDGATVSFNALLWTAPFGGIKFCPECGRKL